MATARDLMDPTPLTVGPEQGVKDLVRLMADVSAYVACIIDDAELVGVVSSRQIAADTEVVNGLLAREEPAVRARDLMVTPPEVPPDLEASEVLARLHRSPADCLAVIDDTGFLGVVSRRTVVSVLAGESMEPRIIK